jgi:hypothetical protein
MNKVFAKHEKNYILQRLDRNGRKLLKYKYKILVDKKSRIPEMELVKETTVSESNKKDFIVNPKIEKKGFSTNVEFIWDLEREINISFSFI